MSQSGESKLAWVLIINKAVGQQDVYIQNERSYLGSRIGADRSQEARKKAQEQSGRSWEIMMPVALHSKSGYGVAEGPFLGGGKRAACTWKFAPNTESRLKLWLN